MSLDQDFYIIAGIIVAVAAIVMLYARLRFRRGMAIRIFSLLTPGMGMLAILGVLWGKLGLTWQSIAIIAPLGTAAGVIPMVLLFKISVRTLDAQVQGLQRSIVQLSATAQQSAATAAEQSAMVAQVSTSVEEISQTSTVT